MIKWTPKGEGLVKAIADAGHWVYVEDGVYITSDDDAVQAIIDSYPLSAQIDEKCAEVEAYAAKLLDAAAMGKSALQLAYEPIKKIEADALAKGGAAPTLAAEAAARGITVEELAAKVLSKSDTQAQIVGVAGKHKDAIRALTTFEDVRAYDYSVGWPA